MKKNKSSMRKATGMGTTIEIWTALDIHQSRYKKENMIRMASLSTQMAHSSTLMGTFSIDGAMTSTVDSMTITTCTTLLSPDLTLTERLKVSNPIIILARNTLNLMMTITIMVTVTPTSTDRKLQSHIHTRASMNAMNVVNVMNAETSLIEEAIISQIECIQILMQNYINNNLSQKEEKVENKESLKAKQILQLILD